MIISRKRNYRLLLRPRTPLMLILAALTIAVGLLEARSALAEEDALVVGVFPRRSAEATVRMFTPLTDYLSAALKRPVKLETARNFDAFWDGVKAQRYDIVHFNQFHYLQAHDRHGYDVFACNNEFGRDSLAGAIYVRKDSGITDVAHLKGKKIVFGGGKDAMMSYIVPRYLLQEAGLKPGDYTEEFAVNPPNAVVAVFFGQTDASGAGDVVIDLPHVRKRIKTDEVAILARSEQIFHLPWVYKPDLSAGVRERLPKLFTALNETDKGKAILKSAGMTGISAASDQDYDPHRRIVEAVFGTQY